MSETKKESTVVLARPVVPEEGALPGAYTRDELLELLRTNIQLGELDRQEAEQKARLEYEAAERRAKEDFEQRVLLRLTQLIEGDGGTASIFQQVREAMAAGKREIVLDDNDGTTRTAVARIPGLRLEAYFPYTMEHGEGVKSHGASVHVRWDAVALGLGR